MTGDSWAASISRSLFAVPGQTDYSDYGVACFFIAYILVSSIMLLNAAVVVHDLYAHMHVHMHIHIHMHVHIHIVNHAARCSCRGT